MNRSIDNSAFEAEVYRIADVLLSSVQEDEDGLFWQRVRIQNNGQSAPLPETMDIFNGSAGTVLFFLTLYRYHPEERYLSCCQRVLDRLLKKTYVRPPAYYTMYTGATGLIHVCISMYEATGAYRYIEEGLQLASHLEKGMLPGVVKDDLLSGHAGNLLAISYLYAHSGSAALLPLIRQLCDILITHARITSAGLKWDNEKFAYDSLTGFSHGAAGIGYVLLEVGRYFDDAALRYLGEEALAYEMQYYDTARNNWMDLRVNSLKIPQEDIADWRLAAFQKKMSDACSWAHGATGSSLARLHAYNTTGHSMYAVQADAGIQRTLQELTLASRNNYTLCSGYGGHILLLLKAAQVLNNSAMYEQATIYAHQALQFFKQRGTYNTYSAVSAEDPALLSGLAGVGYMYLQLLLPYNGNTILHPVIPGHATDHGTAALYDITAVKTSVFGAYFKQTLSLLAGSEEFIKTAGDVHALQHALSLHIDENSAVTLQDAFSLECAITTLWIAHKGMLCHRKKAQLQQIITKHMQQYNDDILKHKVLQVCSNVRLHKDKWGYKVLYSHEKGVSALPVTLLPALILQQLRKPCSTATIIDAISETHFSHASTVVQRQVSQSIIDQVRSMLQHGLITLA